MPFARMIGLAAAVSTMALAGAQPAADPAPAQPPAAPPAQPAAAPPQAPEPAVAPTQPAPVDPHVLSYVMDDLDGKKHDLAQHRGRVVLIVNVASNCGFTKQYKGLEALYQSRKDKGLVVLAFPANDFAGQEPGDAARIKETCYGTYKVTFPMFSKISVVAGSGQAPLYRQIAMQPSPIGGDPKWNFTKFLVNREGRVIRRYEPRVKPDDEGMLRDIDDELAKPAPSTPEQPKPAPAPTAPATPPADPGKE